MTWHSKRDRSIAFPRTLSIVTPANRLCAVRPAAQLAAAPRRAARRMEPPERSGGEGDDADGSAERPSAPPAPPSPARTWAVAMDISGRGAAATPPRSHQRGAGRAAAAERDSGECGGASESEPDASASSSQPLCEGRDDAAAPPPPEEAQQAGPSAEEEEEALPLRDGGGDDAALFAAAAASARSAAGSSSSSQDSSRGPRCRICLDSVTPEQFDVRAARAP
jgi:hypothetical protein